MTLRILLFGRSGQIGAELLRRAGPRLSVRALGRAEADLGDPAACAARIAEADVDAVVNAAAYTAVDRAESEEALAMAINADAPAAMAAAAAARGLPFLHLSTDYVFDGRQDRPWRETDPVWPINAYGRSKLAGEQAVRAAGGPHVVLRTSWVFSPQGRNFVSVMLRKGVETRRLSVVDDQRGGPTAAADIVGALTAIATAFRDGRGASGVFHFCGAPATSWRGFAVEIFRRASWIATPEIAPVASEDWPTAAERPRNSTLDCGRIRAVYGIEQPDWRPALDRALAEMRETV